MFLMMVFMIGQSALAGECPEWLQKPKLIRQVTDFHKLPIPNRTGWFVSESVPEDAPVTAAYIFAFLDGKILLARHRARGWDLLGGHIDPGETSEQATRREAHEEAKATVGKMIPLGYQEIELLGSKPDGYKYPHPKSYQAFYVGIVVGLEEFEEEEDMVERRWFTFDEARAEADWVKRHPEFFEAALVLSGQL